MYQTDSLKIISERLFKENICKTPLDERSLTLIESYMGLSETGSDLMRRLSDVEINYAQILSEASQARVSARDSVVSVIQAIKALLDDWHREGLLRDFLFSLNEIAVEYMQDTYGRTFGIVCFHTNSISELLVILCETSAQMRACSASFMEIYRESRLADYAAMLNKDVENVLSCRAISLQSHASSSESKTASSAYLGSCRSYTKAINVINERMSEAGTKLNLDPIGDSGSIPFSPASVGSVLKDTICSLEAIISDMK